MAYRFAEYPTVPAAFTYPLAADAEAALVAPLLFAGIIGYRALAQRIGAVFIGNGTATPPESVDAAIVFAPAVTR